MKKIMIVDDSQVMRKVLRDICESGHLGEVVEATNGQEALSIFEQEQPQLVFLDVIMPDISGLEVLRQIGGRTNVVMVSAIGQNSLVAEADNLGAKGYVVKPFDKEVIVKKISTLLSA